MPERFAIYYAPAAKAALWTKSAEWLGRDSLSGETFGGPVSGLARERLMALTVSARRYGFHATIKAPMALAAGTDRNGLEAALSAFAARTAPVAMGPLQLVLIDGFLALVPARQSDELTALASAVVEAFEDFRAPLSVADRDKRIAGGRLTPRQIELIDQFGYPYVHEQFQLHMTLTDRLPEAERQPVQDAAAAHFGALASDAVTLDRLVLFHEPEAGAAFVRLGDFELGGEATRR